MVPSDIMNARPQEGDCQVCSRSNPSDSVSEVYISAMRNYGNQGNSNSLSCFGSLLDSPDQQPKKDFSCLKLEVFTRSSMALWVSIDRQGWKFSFKLHMNMYVHTCTYTYTYTYICTYIM